MPQRAVKKKPHAKDVAHTSFTKGGKAFAIRSGAVNLSNDLSCLPCGFPCQQFKPLPCCAYMTGYNLVDCSYASSFGRNFCVIFCCKCLEMRSVYVVPSSRLMVCRTEFGKLYSTQQMPCRRSLAHGLNIVKILKYKHLHSIFRRISCPMSAAIGLDRDKRLMKPSRL